MLASARPMVLPLGYGSADLSVGTGRCPVSTARGRTKGTHVFSKKSQGTIDARTRAAPRVVTQRKQGGVAMTTPLATTAGGETRPLPSQWAVGAHGR